MTETTTPISIGTTVDGYFAMWNEIDSIKRLQVIAATWSPEAHYVDPLFVAEGYEALEAMVVAVHTQYPGYQFRLIGPVELHHDRARWGWELAGPDGGSPAAVGVDFAVLTSEGRLREVTGFFEQPAASA